jgi:hypothetical protein
MLLNQNLLTAAGGVMMGLGGLAKLIPLPAACKDAIVSKSVEQVSAVCGILASNEVMVFVIVLGGVIMFISLFFTTPMMDFIDHTRSALKKD